MVDSIDHSMPLNIWWIRRDLRLHDNPTLHAALENAQAVVPLFILDPMFETSVFVGEKRLAFLYANLSQLDKDLRQRGGRLIIRQGEPALVLDDLIKETSARAVFAQEDLSPYAVERDTAIAHQFPLVLTGGLTTHPIQSIRKLDGSAYTVYTPFSKSWKKLPFPGRGSLLPAPTRIMVPDTISSLPLPTGSSLSGEIPFPPGETEAIRRLSTFLDREVLGYQENRNRMDLDGTSNLSPYFRFGLISPRHAVISALDALQRADNVEGKAGIQTWINELIWREFFISILANFPEVRKTSFREDMRSIAWQNNLADFDAWTLGQTGYPIVDAGMRQLLATGWMHNRARMIVASFLVKDLLIDWRWGERWFMQHLIDGDPAANNGGWQWSAGTGTDAAPYFRIFNPILQSKKFDPYGQYIRQWVPELSVLPDSHIHTPWEMTKEQQRQYSVEIGVVYPQPIVDHQFARQRTLDAYKRAKGSS